MFLTNSSFVEDESIATLSREANQVVPSMYVCVRVCHFVLLTGTRMSCSLLSFFYFDLVLTLFVFLFHVCPCGISWFDYVYV